MRSVLVVAAVAFAAPQVVFAQREALPAGGTLAWNWIVYDPAAEPGGGSSGRFVGRLSVPVHEQAALGLGVGSWVRNRAQEGYDPDALTGRDEAVLLQFYGQVYPLRSPMLFTRLGIGAAHSEFFVPAGSFIDRVGSWRPTATAGIGVDVAVDGPLWVTLSLDYTQLFGVDVTIGEIGSGLAWSVGLTLR